MSDTEVCVVGAGPAGALVANRLASDGHEVTILEAGPRFEERDTERMEQALRPGLSDLGVWGMGGPRDAFSTTGRFYPLNSTRVKGVGGSTNHWQGMVYRLHEADFAGDNNGPAWPISYADLRPYYLAAERAIGVAGDSENPYAPPRDEPHPMGAFPPSYSDSLFADACRQVGVTTHSVGNARNSEAYDNRAACVGYGTCKPVCPSGARYDATHTIAAAEERGVEVIADAPVQRLDTDASGEQVTRAVYVREGSQQELRATPTGWRTAPVPSGATSTSTSSPARAAASTSRPARTTSALLPPRATSSTTTPVLARRRYRPATSRLHRSSWSFSTTAARRERDRPLSGARLRGTVGATTCSRSYARATGIS